MTKICRPLQSKLFLLAMEVMNKLPLEDYSRSIRVFAIRTIRYTTFTFTLKSPSNEKYSN